MKSSVTKWHCDLNEAIIEAKRKKIRRVFFKIDFAKAYDSMDWSFLDTIIETLNFIDGESGSWSVLIRLQRRSLSMVALRVSFASIGELDRGIPFSFLFLIMA